MRAPAALAALALLAALVAGCARHDPAVCSNADATGIVKHLIFGKSPTDQPDPRIGRALNITDVSETGSDGNVHNCTARFSISDEALKAVKVLAHGDLSDERVAQMARGYGMSEHDITAGVDSGAVEYDVAENTTDQSQPRFAVTLKTFNIARAKLFSSYLDAMDVAGSAVTLKSPVAISWSAKDNGSPKLYSVGDLDITMTSEAGDKPGDLPSPAMHLSIAGVPPVDVVGQPGFADASARILVGRLDPAGRYDDVLFLTYSGGAHCCTDIELYQVVSGAWKKTELGSWDGEPLETFPTDVDGDHVADIVFSDGVFNYAFASYAESYAPPRIFNIVAGALTDVSAAPRYANLYRDSMIKSLSGCLLGGNGGCAAFVAAASRIGLHDWAWSVMLDNYNKSDSWPLPKGCDVPVVARQCPAGQEFAPADYPAALANFLEDNGYYQPSDTSSSTVPPGFDCAKVHSAVLQLVCTTPDLSTADQELGAAYYIAMANNPRADALRAEQRAWIAQRNNSAPDADTLRGLYRARIAALLDIARQEAAAPPATP